MVARRAGHTVAVSLAAILLLEAGGAIGAPSLRLQVDQRGDFALIGNTLGHECGGSPPAPVIGTVGSCGGQQGDSAPDVFWRSDSPGVGQAEANVSIGVAEARSSASLVIPPGATVTHARLYWAARGSSAAPDTSVLFDRPGGFSANVTADDSFAVSNNGDFYQATSDVTAVVGANGQGIYRLGGVDAEGFTNRNQPVNFAAWWLVVFYELSSEPPRNLALFDGLDRVGTGASQVAALSGFLVPTAGFDAKLGVVTYEGDEQASGDSLLFGTAPLTSSDRLSDAQNPVDNFFNSSRTFLGSPVSVVGDLPQLTGGPGSMSSVDFDVVDVSSRLTGGQTSVDIEATSTGDVYFLGGFITSISVFKPDFTTSGKTVVDLDGGAVLPGDTLEYTIDVVNTGNDASLGTMLTDTLPSGVSYVADSLSITTGPNAGPLTDGADTDQGEFVGGTVTVRLGTGADGTTGGTLAIGQSTSVVFRVTVDPSATGTVSNQAVVTAAGQLGAPPESVDTDSDGSTSGSQPTDVLVEECETAAQCVTPLGACDAAATPSVCVQCVDSADCAGATPVCSGARTCVACSTDADCSGATPACLTTGDCGECSATNTTACIAPTPSCDVARATCVECLADGDCGGATPNCVAGACSPSPDTDGDGLTDADETAFGTDPTDADSDDDGVSDGAEADWNVDSDGDGRINALDADSDDDGVLDGTELGLDCSGAGTGPACVPDADGGATTTDPRRADTDGGSVSDGDEDENRDGAVDPGETDPNDPTDDVPTVAGGAGGVAGSAGNAGSAGSAGTPASAGRGGMPMVDAGAPDTGAAGAVPELGFEGGGITCAVRPLGRSRGRWVALVAFGAFVGLWRRRARRAAAAALGVLAAPSIASAQDVALDRYEPTPAGDSAFSVPDAAVSDELRLSAEALLSFASDPLVLVDEASDSDEVGSVVSHQAVMHYLVSLSVLQRLELELDLPVAVSQSGDDPRVGDTGLASPSGTALADLRLGARIELLEQSRRLPSAALQGSVWLPTGDDGEFGGTGETRWGVGVIVGADYDSWLWRAHVGRTKSPDGVGLAGGLGSNVVFGAAVAFAPLDALQVGPEIFGSTATNGFSDAFSRTTTHLEALAGARYRVDRFVFGAAAGPGLTRGVGTPTYRLIASISYAPEVVRKTTSEAPQTRRGRGEFNGEAEGAGGLSIGFGSSSAPGATRLPGAADADGDGVVDASDVCPKVVGDASPGAARPGCPSDRDADGIVDVDDDCPDEPGVPSNEAGRDGCPGDRDGDGILDPSDACVDEKGAKTTDPKTSGCPKSVRVEGKQIVITEQVNFATGRDVIANESFALLGRVARVFNDHPEIARIAVDGHTDDVGATRSNLDLSRRRAIAVVRWLVQNGVDERRLEARGFGPRQPIADNKTAEGRKKNRRVEFIIVKRSEKGASGWKDGDIDE